MRDHMVKFLVVIICSVINHMDLLKVTPQSQLFKVLDVWTEKLENGGPIVVLYTDLEKAFDKSST